MRTNAKYMFTHMQGQLRREPLKSVFKVLDRPPEIVTLWKGFLSCKINEDIKIYVFQKHFRKDVETQFSIP